MFYTTFAAFSPGFLCQCVKDEKGLAPWKAPEYNSTINTRGGGCMGLELIPAYGHQEEIVTLFTEYTDC